MPTKSEIQETFEELETFVLAEHIVNLIFDDDSDDEEEEDKDSILSIMDLDDLDAKIDALIENDFGIGALMDDDDNDNDEENDFDDDIIDGMSIAETMYLFVSSMNEREQSPAIDDHCRHPVSSHTDESSQTLTPCFLPSTTRKRKHDAIE
ncbi:hypothetical protein O0I10_000954 [Lichtheimia ornata]|uniref:Uncharacterized protein n=1 Tax=Lichtheimia ornata TaxID=688661 RepID=A0AAD8DIT7_9FUNG|nr:uncharacterized protein O0I10_000954 [Lichtheimia ornata]KAJ8663705.1 hypothetical protein O0I10_000954 [Lichtheimia ornata]